MTAQDQTGKHPLPPKADKSTANDAPAAPKAPEHGGPKGPEPTRYQDWERGGRCVDF